MGSDPERLGLIDGYALVYRAHYAMIDRPLRTTAGENTSIPYGLARFLLEFRREHRPDHVAFVLDGAGGAAARRRIYEAYKGTREKFDDWDALEFRTAVGRVRQLAAALRIPVIEIEGWEADDVIGTLARQAVEAGLEVAIVSGDKDFYQLVGDRVRVVDPGRGGRARVEARWVDAGAVADRLGVPPDRVVDYLALVGDPSDNVPGARGIGPKTAPDLIRRYGTLESILEHADRIEPARVRTALARHRDEARLSKELVTIRTDAPVELDLEALRAREPDRLRLHDLFLELEFASLLDEFSPPRTEPLRIEPVLDPGRDEALRGQARAKGSFAFDVDPGGLLAVSIEPGRAHPIRTDRAAWAALPVLKVGHDVKAAILALRAEGVELTGPFVDVRLAAHVLDPTRRGYDLEGLASLHLGHRLAEPDPARPEVAAADRAEAIGRLAPILLAELEARGLRGVLDELEMPLARVLADMETAGILVDRTFLESFRRDLDRDLEGLRAAIHALAGRPFNVDSTVQLRRVLFERLGLPVRKRGRTGPSTDAEVLGALAAEGHALPGLLLSYRELAKLRSTYTEGFETRIDPRTGRLHTRFDPAGTATGRLSSSDPNLQNVPPEVRRAFLAPDRWRLLVADYSQIELRLLAHASREPEFLAAFRAGRDVHRETAALIFGIPVESVDRTRREVAKVVNYATLYGQSAGGLARRLGISPDEADRFLRDYFERLPAIRDHLERTIAAAEATGEVETIAGRRRPIPELRSPNPRLRALGRRVARNTPIQGSAADVIHVAMIRIHARLSREHRRARMLLQIHDELVLEVPEDEVEALHRLVREEMEAAFALEVPLRVEIGTGRTWFDAKPGGA